MGYYYLSLSVFSVTRFLEEGRYFYPSRYQMIVYPLLFVLALATLRIGFPDQNYSGPALVSAMTALNIVFVYLACKLALFLNDRPSSLLMIAAILLNFSMAALLVFLPLENDLETGHYPNLMREIILNSLAQCALLWAALRVREKMIDYAARGGEVENESGLVQKGLS